MKRFIFLFSLIIMFASCDSSIDKVDNPKDVTQEVIEAPKDSVQIVIIDDTMYIMDDKTLLYEMRNDRGDIFWISFLYVAIITLLLIVIFFTD